LPSVEGPFDFDDGTALRPCFKNARRDTETEREYEKLRRREAHEDDIKKSSLKSASRTRRVYAAARVQRLSLSTLEYKIQGESEKKKAKTDATHT